MTVVRHDPDDETSLAYNHIISLCYDRKGFLWIGTFEKGLEKYNPSTEEFAHYVFNPADTASLSNNMIRSIVEDSEGVLWVGTDRGLNMLDRKTGSFERHFSDPENPYSLSSDKITSICEDGPESIWIGTDGEGVNIFDKGTGKFACLKNIPGDESSLSNSCSSHFEWFFCNVFHRITTSRFSN